MLAKNNNFEKRTITFDLENIEEREDKSNVIRGIAIKYNSLSEAMYNSFYERIVPGSLRKTLAEDDQVALWGHDTKYVLGRKSKGTLTLRDAEDGLHFEIVPPNTTWANDLVVSIKRGDIKQMSFGFNNAVEKWYTDAETRKKYGLPIRELLEFRLKEISIVTFPAYKQTSVRENYQDEYIPTPPKNSDSKEASLRRRRFLDIKSRKI